MSNNINVVQNTPKQILRLTAQRILYSRVKNFAATRSITAFLLAVIGFIFIEDPNWKNGIIICTISFFILDNLLLEYLQNKWKLEAATIQEMFDVDVLDLPWDSIRCDKKNDDESIIRIGQNFSKNNQEKLMDWYPKIEVSKRLPLARLICQRSTTAWDFGLRKLYLDTIQTIFVIGLVIAVIIACTLDLTVIKFCTLIPIAHKAISYYNDLGKSNKTLKTLTSNLDELISLGSDNKISDEELNKQSRNIQSLIFEHRKNSVVIFDFIYKRLRESFETSMRSKAAEF